MASSQQQQGFTLVELSIVLVVIGLIVAGVMVGQELIHQGQLRKLNAEVEEIRTAMYTFKGKYAYIPGDIPNATSYWTGGVTRNGNNNSYVDGIGWYGGGNSFESVCIWSHLSLAGLYAGQISPPDCVAQTNALVINVGFPESKALPGVGFRFTSQFTGNILKPALNLVKDGYFNGAYTMPPEDVLAIDRKFDDGKPNAGNIFIGAYDANCNFGNVYQPQNKGIYCRDVHFMLN